MFRSCKDIQIKKVEIIKEDTQDYTCDFCDSGPWSNETDVDIHRKKSHRKQIMQLLCDEESNICSICLKQQNDKPSLIEHIKVAHLCSSPTATQINREVFICEHCHRLFFNKQLLIAHMIYWHSSEQGSKLVVSVSCPKCCKIIRAKTLYFHFFYHGMHSISTCPICLTDFNNCSDMIEHVKTHPGDFSCDICGYQTSKEKYYVKHLEIHKKHFSTESKGDVSRFFLPQKMCVSLKNRMTTIFKGIPLSSLVHVCILCRALCESEEEMRQHIYGAHRPQEEIQNKRYLCVCGEEFFNNVLLKHHIFKMKGEHEVWDGVSALPELVSTELVSTKTESAETEQIVFEVYEVCDPLAVNVNEIIIAGLESHAESEDSPQNYILSDFQQMEQS